VLEFKSKTRTLRIPLSKQAASLIDPHSHGSLLHVGDRRLRRPLIRIFGIRETPRGKRARVTPHDLRRYFKSVGTELGIDPTIMNLLVGRTVKGVDRSYVAKLRLSILRAAAQRIADEIENPQDPAGEDDIVFSVPKDAGEGPSVQSIGSYLRTDALPSLESLKSTRHAHFTSSGMTCMNSCGRRLCRRLPLGSGSRTSDSRRRAGELTYPYPLGVIGRA
jgi:hypothetical protein